MDIYWAPNTILCRNLSFSCLGSLRLPHQIASLTILMCWTYTHTYVVSRRSKEEQARKKDLEYKEKLKRDNGKNKFARGGARTLNLEISIFF